MSDEMSDRPQRVTVGELIEQLKRFPPEWAVMIDGYEGEFDYPWPTRSMRARIKDRPAPWYYGQFVEVVEPSGEDAVLISRHEEEL